MTRRHWIALGLLVCSAQAFGQAPRNDAPDRMVARLLPLARGVSAQFDGVAQAVRRDSLLRLLASHGIRPSSGEGVVYYELSAAYFERLISCCVTDGMREYVSMEREVQERLLAADGGILVPLDTIITRMIRAERFLAAWPASVAVSQMKYERDRYLAWILYGIDNSPAFNFKTLDVLPEYRAAMERLASARSAEHSGKAAQSMLNLLRENGYRRTPAVDAYIREAFKQLRPPQ